MTDVAPPELLDAVNVVVDQYGWGHTTLELIASAAGMNRTTLYRKGHTREQLLAAAALAAAAHFESATLGPLIASGTAFERMNLLLESLYDLADAHLGLLAGLYDGPSALFHLGAASASTEQLTRFEYTAPFHRLLLDGNHDNTLVSQDPGTDAELIFNTAGWTYIHMRRSHQWSPRQARDHITRITLAAFVPDGG